MKTDLSIYSGYIKGGGFIALIGSIGLYGLIYSHLASFLTSKANIPSTPLYLAVTTLGLLLASGFFTRRWPTRAAIWVISLVIVYIFILLVSLLFTAQINADLVRDRISWAIFFISATIILSNVRKPAHILLIVRVVVAGSAALILAEFFSGFTLPVQMTTTLGRAAGLFENPNNAALFITAALPIVTIGLRLYGRLFWYVITLTAAFVTFSRSGLLLCGLMIILIESFPINSSKTASLRRLIACVLLVALILSLYGLISTYIVSNFSGNLNANTISRVKVESNFSSDVRLQLLKLAWVEFANSPIWGHGVGAGNHSYVDQSVHNMFALLALEYGIIGLAWLCIFLFALGAMPRPFGTWCVGLFLGAAPFTHNLMDGPTYALILASYVALPAVFSSSGINGAAPHGSLSRTPHG